MIDPKWRFWVASGALEGGSPSAWHIVDWDLLRWYTVKGSNVLFPVKFEGDQGGSEVAMKILSKCVDTLNPNSYSLTFDDKGVLVRNIDESIPEYSGDPTPEVRYPRLFDAPREWHSVVKRHELTEVDRLAVCVDLVEQQLAGDVTSLTVFKYTIIQQRILNIWKELHILLGLNGHKGFVPLESIVIDNVVSRVVGFTTTYISGGSLEENKTQPFRFCWLKQLTDAIDVLNLKFGIMHQDLAPRNVLIDPDTTDLTIFDFDRSGEYRPSGLETDNAMPRRNDVDAVIFTVYEALTGNTAFRDMPFEKQDVQKLEDFEDWKLIIPLEEGRTLREYREYLSAWARGRREAWRADNGNVEAPEQIVLPTKRPESPVMVPDAAGKPTEGHGHRARYMAEKFGDYVIRWERLPQQVLVWDCDTTTTETTDET